MWFLYYRYDDERYRIERRNPNASDDEIREYLIGNLCRCTGYESQLRGVRKYLQGGL